VSASTKPANPLKVAVRDLPASRTITVGPDFVDAAVKGMTLREALEGEGVGDDGGTAVLELYEDGENVFANGTFKGQVSVACSRCVTPTPLQIDEPIRVTFLPASKMPAPKDDAEEKAEGEDGVELEENDLDVYPFDGEIVDLEPLIRDQFVLAIPFAPLCREDCAGLCAQCGADKNVAPCNCAAPIDPRFAGLQSLKLPS
jgi:uncharacterized protein